MAFRKVTANPMSPQTISKLKTVWRALDPARRRASITVVLLVIASGAVELVSIGAVIPFLTLLAGLQSDTLPAWLSAWTDRTGLDSVELAIAATVLIAAAAIAAGIIRLLLTWKSQKFVFGASYDLSVKIYSTTLHQPYPSHVARNSADMLADINKSQILAGALFMPLVQAAGSAVIALILIVGLLLVSAKVALSAGIGFALIYALVIVSSRRALNHNGVTIARAWASRIKVANEGLGGIRDIILDQTHQAFIDRFKAIDRDMQQAQLVNNFLSAAPRFVVEALGIMLMASVALAMTLSGDGLITALPVLGAMALGAQRLLPLIQSVFTGWAALKGSGEMLHDLVATLSQVPPPAPARPTQAVARPSLARAITLDKVSFAYPGTPKSAIEQASLTIRAGDRVGIIGRSGSGKSTLMDLLLGLQSPTEGQIVVDDVALDDDRRAGWRRTVAHVPQLIYLADSSIAENIAFGVPRPNIDWPRIEDAVRRAQLTPVVDNLPDGLDSVVGERGARLSGGERQRIGLARALYKQAQLLVLDEATSALDSTTEEEVNAAIRALDRSLTIVIVSHRASSLALCERWFWIDDGIVQEVDQKSATKKVGGLA